jgi:RNA polymerase sigma factor (sigma-70 family)
MTFDVAEVLILREKRVLTQEAFDKLLARLGSDRERAGVKYELLRANIIGFFRRQGIDAAADLADEAINRVARKIAEGEIIPDVALPSYVHSIARNVWREYLRHPDAFTTDLDSLPPRMILATNPADEQSRMDERLGGERRLEYFGLCMEKLNSDDRQLLREYYLDEHPHIENRKLLAERLGVTLPYLRVRVQRLREKLSRCVQERLGGSGKLRN